MRSASLEARPLLNTSVGDSDVTCNVCEQGLHVAGHVGVVLVVFLRVCGFRQHTRLFFVAARGVRVQGCEPGLGCGGVSHEADVHVEGAEVGL